MTNDSERVEISRRLSAWHLEWSTKHGFDLDDDAATVEAVAEYGVRVRQILGLDPVTGRHPDAPPPERKRRAVQASADEATPPVPSVEELMNLPADEWLKVMRRLTDGQRTELRDAIRRDQRRSRRQYGRPVPRVSPFAPDVELDDYED
ncbi:hypothetical protein ACQEU3_39115 [Spirillospora sp. CA-253888]